MPTTGQNLPTKYIALSTILPQSRGVGFYELGLEVGPDITFCGMSHGLKEFCPSQPAALSFSARKRSKTYPALVSSEGSDAVEFRTGKRGGF